MKNKGQLRVRRETGHPEISEKFRVLWSRKSPSFRAGDFSGQMTIEYVVMFTVIVAVILYASTGYFKPVLNRYFNSAAQIINKTAANIETRF